MATKDNLSKKYMREPQRFADLFNGIIYKGKQVIDWTTLEEIDSSMISSIPYSDDGKTKTDQKFRDIIKRSVIMKNNKLYYVILGIENQTDIHYAMPVRDMLYDALAYLKQVEEIGENNRIEGKCTSDNFLSGITKSDKLMPVVTITLYWGTKPWDAPTSLKDMLTDMDPAVLPFINDYSINLFSIIDKNEFPVFHTDLRELFFILNARNDKAKLRTLVQSEEVYTHINRATAEMIRDFAAIKLPRKNKEGEYNMCKAVMDLKEEGKEEGLVIGREEGRVEGIAEGTISTLTSLVKDGLLDIKEAAKRAGLTVDEMKAML